MFFFLPPAIFTIISPSKTQDFTRDFSEHCGESVFAVNQFHQRSWQLAQLLRQQSTQHLSVLMKLSDKLATLNHDRWQSWQYDTDSETATVAPALFAFRGDVYRGFALEEWRAADYSYATEHLGIISGLYGMLAPLQLMQPYRLEMGTRLPLSIDNQEYKNLYKYWRAPLTAAVNAKLKNGQTLLNLASVEYSKVLDRSKLKGNWLDITFKVARGSAVAKVIAIYAKRARGQMANWIVQQQIDQPAQLPRFFYDGWQFSSAESDDTQLTFIKTIK